MYTIISINDYNRVNAHFNLNISFEQGSMSGLGAYVNQASSSFSSNKQLIAQLVCALYFRATRSNTNKAVQHHETPSIQLKATFPEVKAHMMGIIRSDMV